MNFLEALGVLRALSAWPLEKRLLVFKKITGYFFRNAIEISACPFLEGQECLIYPDRFFGCRAYGLWSAGYYRETADKNRQGKVILKEQWKKMGIDLPQAVIDFRVPYCREVRTDPPGLIDDEGLSRLADQIDDLSGSLGSWDLEFRKTYFSDLSFYLASLQFGIEEAVRLKFFIVRDLVQKRERTRLDQALDRVVDVCL
jgi:Fe-S-cluster containining protein